LPKLGNYLQALGSEADVIGLDQMCDFNESVANSFSLANRAKCFDDVVIQRFTVIHHMGNNSLELMSIVALQLADQKILIKFFRKSIPEKIVLDESFIIFGTSADD